MTPEDLEKIYSDQYADFIIAYNGDSSILKQYQDSSIQIINFFLAVIHLPVSQMTEEVITKVSYASIPSLFGLTSEVDLEASGIKRLRSIPNFNLRGKDVLIGIADSGIDYTNPIFQRDDKTTKIDSIWDQTIVNSGNSSSVAYGTEYSKEQINEALKSKDPFRVVPSRDEIGHGTMVAGIANGNEVPESDFYGVAPEAELVIVKLKPAKANLKNFFRIPENAISYQENDILFAIQYLLDYATKINKPMVICIAFDTSQYAHDGRGTTSSWLSLKAKAPGFAILTSVGSEGNARRHYYGEIKEDVRFDTVELNVGANEEGFSMEIWGTTPNFYTIDITSPLGDYIPQIAYRRNETKKITFIFEETIIYINYQMIESQSGDQLILLRFSKPTKGIWKFNVYGKGIYPMNFHIWLPMKNYITENTFFNRSDPNTTLLSVSCASVPIAVTAYNTENDSLYLDAGRGYTRIDLIKPDIAAPGVNIVSPTLNQTFTSVTGTSAAVAHTAGVAAMLLEWGIIKGNYPKMSTQDIKIFMIRGAKRNPDIRYPNQEWGYGILDVYNAFESLRREV